MTQIREGFATALDVIEGVQVSAWSLSNPTPPVLQVFPDSIEYDQTFGRGHDDWFMLVQGFVALIDDIGAQQLLDTMLAPDGPASVKEALEAEDDDGRVLGGLIDDLRVVSCTGYRTYELAGLPTVLGAEWRVQVIE